MFTLRWWGGTFSTGSPSSRIRPAVGTSKPASIRSVVVLPQPEGPSREKNSPWCDREFDVINRDEVTELLGDPLNPDRFAAHLIPPLR